MADFITNLTDDDVASYDNAEPVNQNVQLALKLQKVITYINAIATTNQQMKAPEKESHKDSGKGGKS